MEVMRICLVEDDAVADLEPLTLTRAAYELRLGCETLGQRITRAFEITPATGDRGAILRSSLAPLQAARGVAANDREWLSDGHVLVANARWVPPTRFVAPDFEASWVGLCEGEPACAWVGPEQAQGLELNGLSGWFEEVADSARVVDLAGEWIRRPWDLVARNAEYLNRDLSSTPRGLDRRDTTGLSVVGPSDRLFLDR